MAKIKVSFKGMLIALILFTALISFSGVCLSEDYPTKPIEIIVQSGVGGSTDLFARAVVDIINKNKLVDGNIIVVNKQGGNGRVAIEYMLRQKKGDEYTLFSVPGGGFPANIARKRIKHEDFRQIAIMGWDQRYLAVRADSPYQTIQELIKAASKKPRSISAGVVAVGGGAYMAVSMLELKADVEINIIPFKGGSEAVVNLLGGNVDIVAEGLITLGELLRAGKVRILGVLAERRQADVPDVPTLKESGYNVVYQLPRGFAMTAGVSEKVSLFWEEVFEKVTHTPEWKEYVRNTGLDEDYVRGDEADKAWRRLYESLVPIFKKIDL